MLYFMNEELADHFLNRLSGVPEDALRARRLQKYLHNPDFHEAIEDELDAIKNYIEKISGSFKRGDLRLDNVFACTKLWLQARIRGAGRRTRQGRYKEAYLEACITLVSEIRESLAKETSEIFRSTAISYV